MGLVMSTKIVPSRIALLISSTFDLMGLPILFVVVLSTEGGVILIAGFRVLRANNSADSLPWFQQIELNRRLFFLINMI